MNWFERHLHLTVLFAVVVWIALLGLPIFLDAGLVIGIFIICGILFLILLGWVLRRKGQTLWFMAALLFFWWLIFLIPNKNTTPGKTLEYEYSDESNPDGKGTAGD